ncbi:MAG: hypothetical protein Q8N98_00305, partial [bacterium]|nr:hypothetical protein [bacterium]
AFSRLIHNKFRFYLTTFTDNYLSYFSPQFFFSGNRPDFSYLNLSGFPLLYFFEIPFILTFIALTIRKPAFWQVLLWGWVILAPVPAALTGGSMHANRAVMFLPALQIMGAIGGYGLFIWIRKIFSGRLLKTIKTGFIVIVFVSVASFLDYYFIHLPRHNSESLRVGYREMVKYLLTVEEKYETIVVSLKLTEPQSFVAFYGKKDPRLVQRESIQWLKYEEEGKKYLDQLDNYRLGKYWFKRMNYQDEKHFQETIFAGKTEEFPEEVIPLFAFNDFEGKPVYKILESDKNGKTK